MTLDQRAGSVVQYVAKFGQLSSAQVHELVFSTLKSRTPADRTLRRLVRDDYLVKIERRIVGGSRGGSGQYVYSLGRQGFYMCFEGEFKPVRRVNYHDLAVADAYLSILRLERAGRLTILGWSSEPDSWAKVEEIDLRPDFAIDIEIAGKRYPRLWLEVDMGTEGQKQLKTKLDDYWRAYQVLQAAQESRPFPFILWVAIDQERAREIRWLLSEGSERAQALFEVCTLEELPSKVFN